MKVLRTMARLYLHPEDLDATIAFYEELLGETSQLRFTYPAAGLELAQVASVLLIAGSDEALAPVRRSQMTLLVDDLPAFHDALLARGATILDGPQDVPTGMNMHARHPEGTVVEYVEFARRRDAQ